MPSAQKSWKGSPTSNGHLAAAVEYVRMSTDHQRYSTQNQSDAIHAYAADHEMTIIRSYRDEGKSGLDITGREALQRLICEVQTGNPDFSYILVYDISRWGRFQDADESAHYEYLCKQAGVKVIYCAEPFDNDGSPMSSMFKGFKREMAGEYSRELSSKVFAGQCRLIKLGFHQGGRAGYGLRRALLDAEKKLKGELLVGQHKSIQTDRVILVPGPLPEIAIVQSIYHRFINEGMNESKIAMTLNEQGVKTDLDRLWTRGTVHQILTNEKYIGNNIYNRTSAKLTEKRHRNDEAEWVRCNGAFQGIVSAELFKQVQNIILQRTSRLDNEQMLVMLRNLLGRAGTLSGLIIDEQTDMPSSTAYQLRFGGLIRAYALVGFTPNRDYRYLEINRQLRQWRPKILFNVMNELSGFGANVILNPNNDLLTVNDEWTTSVVLARCQVNPNGRRRWRVHFDTALTPDITIAVRMNCSNESALDYYLIPRIDMGAWPQRLKDENNSIIDSYRFDSLKILNQLAARG